MQITIRTWDGSTLDGVIMRRIGLRLRAAVCGSDDIVEFHCRGGQWFSDSEEPVEMAMYSPEFDDAPVCGVEWDEPAREDFASAAWVN